MDRGTGGARRRRGGVVGIAGLHYGRIPHHVSDVQRGSVGALGVDAVPVDDEKIRLDRGGVGARGS